MTVRIAERPPDVQEHRRIGGLQLPCEFVGAYEHTRQRRTVQLLDIRGARRLTALSGDRKATLDGFVERRRHAVQATEQHDLPVEEVTLDRTRAPGQALPGGTAATNPARDLCHLGD